MVCFVQAGRPTCKQLLTQPLPAGELPFVYLRQTHRHMNPTITRPRNYLAKNTQVPVQEGIAQQCYGS